MANGGFRCILGIARGAPQRPEVGLERQEDLMPQGH